MSQKTLGDGGRSGGQLSTDQVLELLGQYQRREIIRHLRNSTDQHHSLDEVVAYLESVERNRTTAVPGQDHLLSVFVHIHGPKLEEAGLIDFDIPGRELQYYPDERVEEMLDCIDEWLEEY